MTDADRFALQEAERLVGVAERARAEAYGRVAALREQLEVAEEDGSRAYERENEARGRLDALRRAAGVCPHCGAEPGKAACCPWSEVTP